MDINQWVHWIQSLHCKEMDLSLERVQAAAIKLNLLGPRPPVITVAGTNGKGSCVRGLESIYWQAGYKTGAFTSPQLLRINELIRINGVEIDDESLCKAFKKIAPICEQVSLTLFEFNTLAAFVIFNEAKLDVWILEVGLGGRYDAVNVVDADVAIIASIDLDHTEWLGDTREKIALEKAGIFRSDKPAVCGDFNPPYTLLDYAKDNQVPLYCQSRDFSFNKILDGWNWSYQNKFLKELPLPQLALQNMSTVLMAIELMQERLPVDEQSIRRALQEVKLPGRIQIIPGDVMTILDVSHNPASVAMLAKWLKENPAKGKTCAVFSMLGDKDILSSLNEIKDQIAAWFIAPLEGKRAASIETMINNFKDALIDNFSNLNSIKEAYHGAVKACQPGDRIVVFGSFHTVGSVNFLRY